MTTKHPTHLVVDGSNIATEGRNTPSLEQLDEAVRAILEEFPHERLTVVVDATFGHRIAESERPAYEEAILAGEIVAPPAGAIGRGDAFILQVADKAGATVFSNDSFQEFHGEHEWLFDDGRLIGGKPVPGVGWVFVPRVPVRGPLSRRAVRESKRGKPTRRTRETAAEPTKRGRQPSASASASASASQPMPTPTAPPPAKRRQPAPTAPTPPVDEVDAVDEAPSLPPVNGNEALNEPTVFLSFIAQNRIGSLVEAVVDHFSSHGAYVVAGGARCYLPTKTMGDPPPNRARDVINRGDVVRVEVQSLDAERRGINVRYVELVESRDLAERRTESATDHGDEGPPEWSDELLSIPAELPRSDSDVATRKTAARRTATKKAPSGRPVEELAARKAPAKKATAEATPSPRAVKATARKAPAKKAATRRATAADDVAPLDDLPIDEPTAPAKKAAAKRTTKRATTKAPATPVEADVDTDVPAEAGAGSGVDEPARKVAARKAPAKKATTKKAAAKKATKKAPAKKAAAEGTAAKKATAATKATATATAKKATAKKATTKKATAKKAATKSTDTAAARRSATKRSTAGTTGRSRTAKKAAAADEATS